MRGVTFPSDALLKPFAKGVSELSSYSSKEVLNRSRKAYDSLKSKGVRFSIELLYENAPKRIVKQVIESNSAVLEASSKGSATIDVNAFVGTKKPSLSDSLLWLQTFNVTFEDDLETVSSHVGPMGFYHPDTKNIMRTIGWGCTDPKIFRSTTSIISRIKSDPYFPRDITDDALTNMLFSTASMEDSDVASNIVASLGCTETTQAQVKVFFGTYSTMNGVVLSSLSGAFTLNTPILSYLDKLPENSTYKKKGEASNQSPQLSILSYRSKLL